MKDVNLWGFNVEEKNAAKDESKVLYRCAHPCIIDTIDSFTSKHGRFMVLQEYCVRKSLNEEII